MMLVLITVDQQAFALRFLIMVLKFISRAYEFFLCAIEFVLE